MRTGMRRNESHPRASHVDDAVQLGFGWLALRQGKVTPQQCCVGKNWIIRFPPFPESVPEEYLFSKCYPDFPASDKTQLKLLQGGDSQQCQPYSSSLVQSVKVHICSHRHIGNHTYTYILFSLGKHWKYTFFKKFLGSNPRVPQTSYLYCSWNVHSKTIAS